MSRKRSKLGSDLGRRLIVALVAVPLLLGTIIAGQTVLAVVLIFFSWVCLSEYYELVPKLPSWLPPPLPLVCIASGVALVVALHATLLQSMGVLSFGAVVSGGMVLFASMEGSSHITVRWAYVQFEFAFFGLIWIVFPMVCAVQLRGRHHGELLLVDVLLAVFISDSFAYLGGRVFGRHPLAPAISPKKTVEGWLIGLAAAVLAVWIASRFESWLPGYEALLLGFAVALVASGGDLFESSLKRKAKVKDSGSFFRSHGGALDRLDAALFGVVTGYALVVLGAA